MKNQYALNLSKYSTHTLLVSLLGDNSTILDVGCNDGYLCASGSKSNTYYGIDYSKSSVEKAQKHCTAIEYDLDHLQDLPWQTKFDTMIYGDVLEHTLHPEKVLHFFVSKYLKTGGKVIISLPNIANWQVRLRLLFGIFDYKDSGIMDRTHLHLYTFKTSQELAKSAGLKVVRVYGGASLFGPIIYMFPFLKGLFATNCILECIYDHA